MKHASLSTVQSLPARHILYCSDLFVTNGLTEKEKWRFSSLDFGPRIRFLLLNFAREKTSRVNILTES
jgi:hypothetical protein